MDFHASCILTSYQPRAAVAAASSSGEGGLDDLDFEDPYEDVIEEDEDDDELDDDEDDDGEDEDMAGAGAGASSSSSSSAAAKPVKGKKRVGAEAMDEDDDGDGGKTGRDVFRPGMDSLGDGEDLDFDPSAYVMYHTLDSEWPCLSFDVMPDRLGMGRTKFPLTCTLVAGTQADKASSNQLLVMRLSSLHKTGGQDSDSDDSGDDSDSDDDLDEDPVLEVQRISHPSGTVNRVRTMPQAPNVVATWSESGKVHLWDVRPQLRLLDAAAGKGAAPPVPAGYGPAMTFGGHKGEGYALDWSPVAPGRLASGDCNGRIHVWEPDSAAAAAAVGGGGDMGSVWKVDGKKHHSGHSGSVEDLQWSPNEGTVFASCSADKTLRIWDTRVSDRSMLSVPGADCDVNVISWSRLVSYLLASGAEDGSFSIWDLRAFKADGAIAHFGWHKQQVRGEDDSANVNGGGVLGVVTAFRNFNSCP